MLCASVIGPRWSCDAAATGRPAGRRAGAAALARGHATVYRQAGGAAERTAAPRPWQVATHRSPRSRRGGRAGAPCVLAAGRRGRQSNEGAALRRRPSFTSSFDLAASGRSASGGVRGGRYVAAARLDGAHLAELVRSLDADPTLRAVLLELAAARVDRRFEVRAGRLVVVFLAHLLCSFEADVD